ncbi:glucosamine 6-phosphate N-acetyltransferase [Talaromyces pinophilus]|uniref:Glucosamine 6-phosphate N-acetyltransferase n=1 Tax=Talaromyces pinophilus TaxID=128442 RepID=A0A6V8HK97_TALPI|nr:glucosamine 6-phosphate N-acetyltransferase [Talaromyces pinophilus]
MAVAELDFIFDSSLISQEIQADYPAGYTIRPLARDDYKRGFFQCLQALTFTGDISETEYLDRFDWHKNHGQGWYYCVVIVEDAIDRIVGTGTVIVERKFIHNLGISGHIEDISIAKDHQGKHFGQKLIKTLDSVAVNVGCYKSILNCSLKNAGFYAKCGYEKQSIEMAHLYPETRAAFEEAQNAYERSKNATN